MSFYNIAKVEFYKILKKRLSLVMLAILFVPVFYTFSVVTNAPLLEMTPSGALDFALAQWDLLGMTGLFQILFSLVTVGAFSAEMEKGQLRISVVKLCNRKKLIYAKMAALIAFMILCYTAVILFSFACYYLFVINTPYGTGEFVSEAMLSIGIDAFVISSWFSLIDVLITSGLVFLFSLRYKTSVCFMLAVGTSTLLLVMQFFPYARYLVPAYVGTQLNYGQISPRVAGIFCIVYLLITLVLVKKTARGFERMDLK